MNTVMKEKIIVGDCADILQSFEGNSVDITVTSPPYDGLRKYDGYSVDFDNVFKQLYRVTKKGGVVVWIVADQVVNGSESGSSFRHALGLIDCGFNLHDTMIWEKDTFTFPSPTRYHQCHEYMFVLSKGTPKTVNLIRDRKNKWAGTKVHGTSRNVDGTTFRKSNHNKSKVSEYGVRFNVWKQPTEKRNRTGHPAPFPEELARDHILSWSREGDTVLDPFMGSGTTLVAAKKTGRIGVGIEISEKYASIANSRLKS